MNNFIRRFIQLNIGLFLYGLGIVFCIRANIGYAPWEIFHVGLSKVTGLSIGVASIVAGFVIILIVVAMGEKLGLGTWLNMVLVGLYMDLVLMTGLIPLGKNFWMGLLLMSIGIFIICLATYYYIRSGFGAGPRDSAMVALHRKTGVPVGLAKAIIETSAALIGWRMGGMLGIGTFISVFLAAVMIQLVFRMFKFDPKQVKHETLSESLRNVFKKDEA